MRTVRSATPARAAPAGGGVDVQDIGRGVGRGDLGGVEQSGPVPAGGETGPAGAPVRIDNRRSAPDVRPRGWFFASGRQSDKPPSQDLGGVNGGQASTGTIQPLRIIITDLCYDLTARPGNGWSRGRKARPAAAGRQGRRRPGCSAAAGPEGGWFRQWAGACWPRAGWPGRWPIWPFQVPPG